MRALKTFMRNRKKEMLWCGPCECRTLQCRRYANENCGCGEWGSSLPPLHNVIEMIGDNSANMLTDGENYLHVEIATDPETWDTKVEVSPYWFFADERYTIDDYNGRQNIFTWFDTEAVIYLIWNSEELPSDLFTLFNAYYQTPTEANEQAAYDAAVSWIPPY